MNESIKPTVLAIDDQPVILHAIASQLRALYHVKAFTSGEAALEYLCGYTADIVILDYEMPGMSGFDVLKRLRADTRTSGIPVIFLTGSENSYAEAEVLEKGASDYIQKPIKAQVLLTRVRLQLELSRYRNHLESLVRQQTKHLEIANERLKVREEIALNLLAEATDMRDHETGNHIKRVTEMVKIIVTDLLNNPCEGYELTEDEADDIVRSVKLHDLGKIAIPDYVLLKPGKLDDNEFEIIKTHALHVAGLFDKYIRQMGSDSFLDMARDIALNHHEKWNGTGYPNRLQGDAIPVSARITALADVYDALTSIRPYKQAFAHSDAVSIITADSGIHFDPVLVSVFLKHEKTIERIASLSADSKQVVDGSKMITQGTTR